MHERGLFNRYKQDYLSESEGPITMIKWRGRFAAWTTNKGIKVYDVVEEKTVSIIKSENQSEKCPYRIAWSDQFHLFVAMGDVVKCCVVKKRDQSEMRGVNAELPEHKVEIASSFQMPEFWVSGVAPFDKLLVLLTVPKEKTKDGGSQKPLLQVVEPQPEGYTEVSQDLLSIRYTLSY